MGTIYIGPWLNDDIIIQLEFDRTCPKDKIPLIDEALIHFSILKE